MNSIIRTLFAAPMLVSGLLAASPANAQDTVIYYHTDAIGSVRAITNNSGVVIARYDYMPFGELPPTNPPQAAEVRQFAGKERDSNTELDYFGARYYRAVSGRFISVDPVIDVEAAIVDPQRWNRYTYALNRPFTMGDPDGRNPVLLLRLAQLAANAASRYGTSAYNWATRFFNNPLGQEVTQTIAEVATGTQLPFGFSNAAQFGQFRDAVSSGLDDVARGTRAFLTGSAVSGANFRTGSAFDVGRTSDFDIALVGERLLTRAKELGFELRSGGTRTGPLGNNQVTALGLEQLAQRLSTLAGRPVRFMIYQSEEAFRARSSGHVPLF